MNRASHNTVKTGGGKRYCDSTVTFPKCHLSGPRNKPRDEESGVGCQNSNSAVPTTKPCSLLKPCQDCPSSTELHLSPIV